MGSDCLNLSKFGLKWNNHTVVPTVYIIRQVSVVKMRRGLLLVTVVLLMRLRCSQSRCEETGLRSSSSDVGVFVSTNSNDYHSVRCLQGSISLLFYFLFLSRLLVWMVSSGTFWSGTAIWIMTASWVWWAEEMPVRLSFTGSPFNIYNIEDASDMDTCTVTHPKCFLGVFNPKFNNSVVLTNVSVSPSWSHFGFSRGGRCAVTAKK